jgi:ABC-type phosphate/phosphonate transport system substrate-binding protein
MKRVLFAAVAAAVLVLAGACASTDGASQDATTVEADATDAGADETVAQ